MGHDPVLEMPVTYYIRRVYLESSSCIRPIEHDFGSVTAFPDECLRRSANQFPKNQWSGLLWAMWTFETRATRGEARNEASTRRPDKLVTLPPSSVFRPKYEAVLPSLAFKN